MSTAAHVYRQSANIFLKSLNPPIPQTMRNENPFLLAMIETCHPDKISSTY